MKTAETKRPAFNPVWDPIKVALSLLCLAFVLYLLWELRSLIGSLAVASLIAYALSPIVSWLEKAGVNRSLGILLVTTLMVAAIAALLVVIIPALYNEAVDLVEQMPGYFQKVKILISSLWERVFDEEFPSDIQSFIDTLTPQADALKAIAGKAAKPIGTMIAGTFKGIVAFILWVVGFAMMPVMVFYLLRDFDKVVAGVAELIPSEKREYLVGLFREINSTLGNLIRGQLLVALILSVLYSLGLWLIGVPYWPLLGFISGFANIIPYFSLVVGFIPSAIIAGIHSEPWWVDPLYVILLFAIVQTLEGLVITPKIVGDRVGLHPLLIILALIVGGTIGGMAGPIGSFLGVVLAVPSAAVLKVLVARAHRNLKGRAAERQHPGAPIEAESTEEQPEVDAKASPELSEREDPGHTAPDKGKKPKSGG
ncbi:MAG: AI-2E family transporter [Candidatus Coatesbacteria bacterium]|nr:AI-2E family transporter [Candidatus Coatesbacteria bacterium]